MFNYFEWLEMINSKKNIRYTIVFQFELNNLPNSLYKSVVGNKLLENE